MNFWRLKNKQIPNKNITTIFKKSNAGTETEAIVEISKVPSFQNADVLGVFLTCTSNTSLDKNITTTSWDYLTILRMVVTMVTGHGDVHLIPANKRNGSSSNTWSSLSS